jgi:hypothetical protein
VDYRGRSHLPLPPHTYPIYNEEEGSETPQQILSFIKEDKAKHVIVTSP